MESIFPLLFVLIAALVIGGAIYSHMATRKRREELRGWALSHGMSFSEGADHGFDQRFPFSALRQGDGRYAYNTSEGPWNGRGVMAFDYHYETHSTDKDGNRQTHHHHFSAAMVMSAFPLKQLAIRPEGLFDKVTAFFGSEDINFESAEFSRRFFVKSPDRRWAYDVIHTRAMEFLLAHPDYSIEFGGDLVFICNARRWCLAEFDAALGVAAGFLDLIPEYVRKQQDGGAGA
jgi:hypothetical protein